MENSGETKMDKKDGSIIETVERLNSPKSSKKILIMVILTVIVLIGVGSGVAGLALYVGKSSETDRLAKQIAEKENEITQLQKTLTWREDEQSETKNPLLHLDVGKCLNCEAPHIWTIVNGSIGSLEKYFSLHASGNKVAGAISWDDLSELYWPNEPKKTGIENVEINMTGQVVDIHISGFGQATGNETALFLMEDGSVEYASIRKVLQDGELRIHGKVPGIEHIVKFYNVVQHGYHILAQRADGDYYDLGVSLSNTENYHY